jgi:predicted lipoprotein
LKGRNVIEIEFTVWQFVRVMVELERRKSRSLAWKLWQGSWEELDGRLDALRAANNTDEFSNLMMNQDITVLAEKVHVIEASEAADRVVAVLGKTLKKTKDRKMKDDLMFEQGELSELHHRLKMIARNLP